MDGRQTRRGMLGKTASAILGAASLGGVASAGSGSGSRDGDRFVAVSSGRDWSVSAAVRSVDRGQATGTTVEDLRWKSDSTFGLEYVRTAVWDGTATLDVRNDAKGGEVRQLPTNDQRVFATEYFPMPTGNVYSYRSVLACADKPAVVIQHRADQLVNAEYTVYTLFAPDASGIDTYSGWKTTHGDYDAIVLTDGSEYVAVGQRETWRKAFDGQRVGSPRSKTAREDVYVEDDGWIDANQSGSGRIDAGIGLYLGNRQGLGCCGRGGTTWLTVAGFGDSEAQALEHATEALENGYRTELEKTR